MKAISTNVPGVRIGEGLPRLARIMDRHRAVEHPSLEQIISADEWARSEALKK